MNFCGLLVILVVHQSTYGFPVSHSRSNGSDCIYLDKYYKTGEVIKKEYNAASSLCWIVYCNNTSVIEIPVKTCPESQTTITTTTTTPTRTGCVVNNQFYEPNSDIDVGTDQISDRCYGRRCDVNGQVIHWDNFNCFTTPSYSTTPTTPTFAPETTAGIMSSTFPSGCYENGNFYAPGEEMNTGYDENTNWCYGSYCDYSGNIISWDNFNCKTTTLPPTTPMTTIQTTPGLFGCIVDGEFHPPGSDISSGNDGYNWCFGTYCDGDGIVISWDDWNCGSTTAPTTPPFTSTPALDTTLPQ